MGAGHSAEDTRRYPDGWAEGSAFSSIVPWIGMFVTAYAVRGGSMKGPPHSPTMGTSCASAGPEYYMGVRPSRAGRLPHVPNDVE